MQRTSSGKNRSDEKNIEVRTDGYSFRVRMKLGAIHIKETFSSMEEARAYRDLLRAGKFTDKDQEKVLRAKAEKKKAVDLTIGTLFESYLTEVTIHKKGCKEETYAIRRLLRIKWFANLPVYLADGETIDKLKRELRNGPKPLSDTTIRKYLMLVSHLFNVAVVKRWCKDLQNPITTTELPRPARMRNRRFEAEEYQCLRQELGKARNKLVLPFFEFLVETACRRGEVLRLTWKDVDLEARTAILYDTKNGDDRVIGLSSRAIAILNSLVDVISNEKVVRIDANPSHAPVFALTINEIRFAFEEAKKRAKVAYKVTCAADGSRPRKGFLDDLRLHDCRREATSRMFEKGLDMMEVASQTGHKTMSMLRGYTHLRARDLAMKLG